MNPFDSSGRRGGKPGFRDTPRMKGDDFPYDGRSSWLRVSELSGVPFDIGQSERGVSNGAGVPGAPKGWASDPPKPWDEGVEPMSMDDRVEPEDPPESSDPTSLDTSVGDIPLDQMVPMQSHEVTPGDDLSLTIIKVACELLSPGSSWDELIKISSSGGG